MDACDVAGGGSGTLSNKVLQINQHRTVFKSVIKQPNGYSIEPD